MIFMQGKRGGHINLCMHIRELCYTKGGKGGRVSKKCASKRGGKLNYQEVILTASLQLDKAVNRFFIFKEMCTVQVQLQ